MDTVLEHRPDWVITAACEQAERIMNAGRAQHYDHAVHWLERAQAAYRLSNRTSDWQAYLTEIRTRHQKKYKLMGLLKTLGE
jgi:uncharacterized Zn finger protein